MLVDLLEKLRREWVAIAAAPIAFAFVCIVAFVMMWYGLHWYYSGRLDEVGKSRDQWKTNAEYWKDQASHVTVPDCPAAAVSEQAQPTPHSVRSPVTSPRSQTKQPIRPGSTEPAVPSQSCPNGICIGGNNTGSPTVNNYGPTLPKVSWTLDTEHLRKDAPHPEACVKISIDRTFLDAKFGVICERPCKSVRGDTISPHGGYFQSETVSFPGYPNIAGFVINGPNPMPADDEYLGCVESEDNGPVKVIAVKTVTLTRGGQ